MNSETFSLTCAFYLTLVQPIRVWVSGTDGAGGITSTGCSSLQGPIYVDLHDVKSAYTLDAVKSGSGCISVCALSFACWLVLSSVKCSGLQGNFSRVIVTDNDGPNCPREGAYAKSGAGAVSVVVGASDGCVGPARTIQIVHI